MARSLTEIDELLAVDHHWLTGRERCFFLREYTSERGYGYSDTNSLINNLKKEPRLRGTPQWSYKEQAIRQVAGELLGALDRAWLERATLVPIPPSKAADDPEYDDRMLRVVQTMAALSGVDLDVRPLLRQRRSVEAAHSGGSRLRPHELEEVLEIDEDVTEPLPERICVVDDVLTTGSHFVAAERVLTARFAGLEVVGLFVARRVFPEEGSGPGWPGST